MKGTHAGVIGAGRVVQRIKNGGHDEGCMTRVDDHEKCIKWMTLPFSDPCSVPIPYSFGLLGF